MYRLLTVIGAGSFAGIRYMNEKIRVTKLNQITNKAVQAAQVWLESNKEASNQLYNNKNGVYIPVKFLVNEGLLNLDNTDIKEDDYKDEYVITALSTNPGTTDCQEIDTRASWEKDSPIYICTHLNDDGSKSSNLSIVDPSSISNMNKVKREKYYFAGTNPDNWVTINSHTYRIMYVDTDDSMVLEGESNTFNNDFNGYTMPIASYDSGIYIYCEQGKNPYTRYGRIGNHVSKPTINETGITTTNDYDAIKTSICKVNSSVENYNTLYYFGIDIWMPFTVKYSGSASSDPPYIAKKSGANSYKIHVKNNIKICGGTGDFANPYILKKDSCS